MNKSIMESQKLNYSDAIAELEAILKALESSEEVNMDSISLKVKRAAELMEFCKNKLHKLDESIEKMIAAL